MTQWTRAARLAGGVGLAAVLLAGCASQPAAEPEPESASASDETSAEETGTRVAVAYSGGVLVLDGETLEVIEDLPSEDFVRLNPAGDDRHAFVTTSEGFQVLDMTTPELTDQVVAAATAGHVVRHAGHTVLYDDATSDTTIFETADLAAMDGEFPAAEVVEGVDAHHGVSVLLKDGTFLTTVGDESGRTGIRVLDDHGHEVASSDECPGVHGEGTAQNEAVVFGCENGALLYADGEITKLTAPDEYGRSGNAYVSENSPLVIMDYKNDPDAEGSLLSNIALVDTEAHTYEPVALPDGIQYTWRGVLRTDSGDVIMIGSDGQLHTIDPASGEITESFAAIEAWEGPAEWQEEHPAIGLAGDIAYVTDSANSRIVAIDITTGETIATSDLPHAPNELVVVG